MRKTSIIFGLVVVTIVLLSLYRVSALVVTDIDSGDLYFSEKVDLDTVMIYESLHSVSSTPIMEVLTMTKDFDLMTKEVWYKDQSGAGLPEYPDQGSRYKEVSGWMVIYDLKRKHSLLRLHVSHDYANKITVNNRVYVLADYYIEGRGQMAIQIKRISIGHYLIQRGLSTL